MSFSCPDKLSSTFTPGEFSECSYDILIVGDEQVKIWKTDITRLVDWDLYLTEPYIFLERSINGTTKFYEVQGKHIEANYSEGMDFASIELQNDGKGIAWSCRSSDEPPYLRLDFKDSVNYTTSFEKIDGDIYIKADIRHLIDEQGCFGLTTEDTKSNLVADLIPPFSLNACNLLEGKEIDECKCVFALYQEGGTWGTYLSDTLGMVEIINNSALKSECEEQIRQRWKSMEERYGYNYPEKFGKMNEEILPKLRQTYINYVLKELKK
jgi:hypothetical protein